MLVARARPGLPQLRVQLTAQLARIPVRIEVTHDDQNPAVGLDLADGSCVRGEAACCWAVAAMRPDVPALAGATGSRVRGQVDSWVEWVQLELDAVIGAAQQVARAKGRMPNGAKMVRQLYEGKLAVLEAHLEEATFVADSAHLSLADVFAWTNIREARTALTAQGDSAKEGKDEVDLLARSPAVARWYGTVRALLAEDWADARAADVELRKAINMEAAALKRAMNKAKIAAGQSKSTASSGANEGGKKAASDAGKSKADTKSSGMGISALKEQEFSTWYTQVITRSELIDYYDISGCYILRPNAYHIWQQIQGWFDAGIKRLGVQNAYFPLFVSQDALEVEKDHIEGFSPEVAWVTKSGQSDLAKPIAIRPTSETIMYPAYAAWIRSHRDLPLKLNQWTSVVRWEFKQPTPFIRTREFLWQEGHTAHTGQAEAEAMVFDILELYKRIYEELLAVPVVKGIKSEGEKFAGAHTTSTVEAFVPANGRAIQAATSHYLGTAFSKMFGIKYEDDVARGELGSGKDHQREVHQTSWGCTTRSIGVMIMNHADNKGLVLPPRVAPTQAVIVPITYAGVGDGSDKAKTEREAFDRTVACCRDLQGALKAGKGVSMPELSSVGAAFIQSRSRRESVGGVAAAAAALEQKLRVQVDDRTIYRPGWKYANWELQGACVRIEVGPRDLEQGTCRIVRRDTGEKRDVKQADVHAEVLATLEDMQQSLLARTTALRDSSIRVCTEMAHVHAALAEKCMVLAPWCETEASEEQIKELTQGSEEDNAAAKKKMEEEAEAGEPSAPALTGSMKSLCIPIAQPPMPDGTKCFVTGAPAKRWGLFGRSY